jgi:hypothetical protein
VVVAANAAAPAVVGIATPPPYSSVGSGFIVHPSGAQRIKRVLTK